MSLVSHIVTDEERDISTRILELLLGRTRKSAESVLYDVHRSLEFAMGRIVLTKNVLLGERPPAQPDVHQGSL